MVSRLALASIILIVAGLVLVIIGNPSLRFVTGTGTTITTFTRTFNFTGGTFPGNFTSFRGPGSFGGSSRVTTAALESLAGVGLVGAGVILEAFSLFVRPKPPVSTP